ncbi:hypothetical protein IE53DRAFT_384017 [Violaceomyces palustris]|uniref:Uncharacterized protein n=1 Tax=Violaceomyces palustris TaxID=1673888 RepID=A0ACD0P5Z6_9BASI|nr:hypothetical protein IE53DRAFT_384017 [Violaceomyces palustris]
MGFPVSHSDLGIGVSGQNLNATHGLHGLSSSISTSSSSSDDGLYAAHANGGLSLTSGGGGGYRGFMDRESFKIPDMPLRDRNSSSSIVSPNSDHQGRGSVGRDGGSWLARVNDSDLSHGHPHQQQQADRHYAGGGGHPFQRGREASSYSAGEASPTVPYYEAGQLQQHPRRSGTSSSISMTEGSPSFTHVSADPQAGGHARYGQGFHEASSSQMVHAGGGVVHPNYEPLQAGGGGPSHHHGPSPDHHHGSERRSSLPSLMAGFATAPATLQHYHPRGAEPPSSHQDGGDPSSSHSGQSHHQSWH